MVDSRASTSCFASCFFLFLSVLPFSLVVVFTTSFTTGIIVPLAFITGLSLLLFAFFLLFASLLLTSLTSLLFASLSFTHIADSRRGTVVSEFIEFSIASANPSNSFVPQQSTDTLSAPVQSNSTTENPESGRAIGAEVTNTSNQLCETRYSFVCIATTIVSAVIVGELSKHDVVQSLSLLSIPAVASQSN